MKQKNNQPNQNTIPKAGELGKKDGIISEKVKNSGKQLKKKASNWRIDRKEKRKEKPDMKYGPVEVNLPDQKAKPGEPFSEAENISFMNDADRNENYRFSASPKYFTICVYALGTIAVAALIIFAIVNIGKISGAIRQFLNVISPFITAFFIAFIINPLVKKIERLLERMFHLKRVRSRVLISMLLSYLIVFGIIVIGMVYVVPQVTESIGDLLKKQEGLYLQVVDFLQNIEEYFPQIDFDSIETQLQSFWPQLVNYGTSLASNMVPKILDLGISIAKIAINLLLSVAISIYMLYDKRGLSKIMTKVVYAVLPSGYASKTTDTVKECGKIFSGFIVGKSIDSLIIGVLCFLIMQILKLPYGVLLSVIVGITNMIPYFGPFIGAVPGILLFLCIHPVDALVFAIMIFALQQFDGWVLGPMILGESTGLTPLWVIFAITVGGAYAGVLGMFLGVPIVAVVAYLMNRLIEGKLQKKRIDIR